jgi:hypothetical protein
MANNTLDPILLNAVRKAQCDEETGAALYAFMAKREKDTRNKALREQMSRMKSATPMCGRAFQNSRFTLAVSTCSS